jgi:dihydrolipoamide dehydrogenase
MASQKTGALIIGAGPGGYVCAIRLGQLGIPTVIVDKGELGGTCLNVGCIPSKALITASKRYAAMSSLATMGIEVADVTVNMETMQTWKESITKKLTGGVGQLLKGNKVKVLRGTATIQGPGRVSVDTHEGTQEIVECDAIVIATGSKPFEIPGFAFDHENILDSTSALSLAQIPEHLVVIGGGYIGLELGGTYGRLGGKITVVEMMDQLLPGFDKALVRPVQKNLKKHGADILLKTRAKGWKKTDNGLVCEVEDAEGKPQSIPCDKILVTVGRTPYTEGLGLETAGVHVDERGFIPTDERRQTNVPGIYAVGDVTHGLMLAHKASKEGEVVAEVIAGKNVVYDVRCVPAVVFTEPEVSSVGLSEAEAKEKGHSVSIGKYPFAGLGRAMTTGETEGFVRVVIDQDTRELLGVQMVGPEASDLIAEAALAIEMGAYADDVGLTIHAHPTLAEAFMEATKSAMGEAIHLINR